VERERGAEDERNALSATLAVQREERAKEAAAVGELEAKLRAELAAVVGKKLVTGAARSSGVSLKSLPPKTLVESTAAEKLAIRSEFEAARVDAAAQHGSSMGSLEQRLKAIEDKLKDAGDKHREIEQGLRKKKEKVGERDLCCLGVGKLT